MVQPDFASDRPPFGAGHSGIYDQVHLAIIKLEGKIDTLMQTQRIRDEALNAELRHIREDFSRETVDHEARLRRLEGRKYVEPKTVWAAVGLFVTVGSLVVAIINLATR